MDVYQIKAIVILDQNGKRLCSCFYDPLITEKDKQSLEKQLFDKSKGSNSELEIIDGNIVIGSKQSDVWIFVVGNSLASNELALLDVLNVLISLFKRACSNDDTIMITKKSFLENYSVCRLYIDEVVSDGIIFETDEEIIVNRVPLEDQAMHNLQSLSQTGFDLVKEKFSLFSRS